MATRVFECVGEPDMLAFGARVAALLPDRAFVALHGDLGAGKSVFTRGIGRAFGILDMPSPTFTIVAEHNEGTRPLLHFDAYRLSDADELYAIGFDDYVKRDAVIAMEWAELVQEALPKKRLDVTIVGSGELPREITVTGIGEAYEKLVDML